ncbi:MAG: tripartite tricarboxylate transporter TctB family protein [Betaproteobacteria bacterium]|jgi:hypothetical protein|nr:tripartite tricarboxylate transporter TctB family protein [Betaproteobacteria bacterium]
MSADNDDARLAKARAKLERGFQGEEDLEGLSTPQKDFIAACVIAAFSVFALVLAWQWHNPGHLRFTHPGLLPIIIGVTLFAMAVGLGVRAVREGGARNLGSIFARTPEGEEQGYGPRVWILIGLVTALVILVDIISFRIRIPIGGFEFKLSSFECTAIPVVTVIMKVFWRASWVRCFLVAAVTAMALAAAFRYGFKIPMPGVD